MSEGQTERVTCSICGSEVPLVDVCSSLACRACHRSLTLEECLAGAKARDERRALEEERRRE